MSYQPVSGIVPQYSDDSNQLASGFYLKFYIANTTTPLSMATDSTGGTLLTKAKLNPDGLPISNPADNTTVFIPHVDQDYRLVIYRNEADANANNTAGAFLNVPKVEPLTQIGADLSDFPVDTSTGTQTLAVALDDRVVRVGSVAGLASVTPAYDGQQFNVGEFWPNSGVGGGLFTWNQSGDKANHDGGHIIDPNKLSDLGAIGVYGTYFTPGTGTGVYERKFPSGIVNAFSFGAFPEPLSANSSSPALAAAAAGIKNYAGGKTFVINGAIRGDLTVDNIDNIEVTGGGELFGKVWLKGERFANSNLRYTGKSNVRVRDLTFNGEGNTRNGVEVEYYFGVTVEECFFKGSINAIQINDAVDYFQNVSRVKFNNNRFRACVRYLNCPSSGTIYNSGDVQFIGNMCEGNPGEVGVFDYSLFLERVDGIQISKNVFFGGHSATIFVNHVYADDCTWTSIKDNQFFLTKDAVRILNGNNFSVTGNLFAYPLNDAVLIEDCDNGYVKDNLMTWRSAPAETYTGSGVTVSRSAGAKNDFIDVSDNMITYMASGEPAVDLVGVGKVTVQGNHCFSSPTTVEAPVRFTNCEFSIANNNYSRGFSANTEITGGFQTYDLGTMYGRDQNYSLKTPQLKTRTYTGNETTIDIDGVDLILLANPAATTITAITATDKNTRRKLTVFSYNSNTSIDRTIPDLVTFGAAGTLTLNSTGAMEFVIASGKILEVNRNNVS